VLGLPNRELTAAADDDCWVSAAQEAFHWDFKFLLPDRGEGTSAAIDVPPRSHRHDSEDSGRCEPNYSALFSNLLHQAG
jgi:hypothetical protein